jgi:hypothetical protein
MKAHETRVYFAGNIGGFDMQAIFLRDTELAYESAHFIATACNAYDTLKAELIALQVEANRLKIDMDIVRNSLETADQAMQNAADVQNQLVRALRLAQVALEHSEAKARVYDEPVKRHADALAAVKNALAAAGVTP